MLTITRTQLAGLLLISLENHSSADVVKAVVLDTGYNDSPFFGAQKKKVRVFGEVATVNTALFIFAVNQVFELRDAKPIIDTFLAGAHQSVFRLFEAKDSGFKSRYSQRMAEYFRVLAEDKPMIGMSFCFLRNLDLDPLKSLPAQVLVAARLGKTLSETLSMLKTLQLVQG